MSYFANYRTPRNKPKNVKIRGGMSVAPEIMALKRSVANPFAPKAAVKVPDGKHWSSTAMKSQAVHEIAFADNEELLHFDYDDTFKNSQFAKIAKRDFCNLLFFPGLNNMLLIEMRDAGSPVTWWKLNEGGPAENDRNNFPNGDPKKIVKYAIPMPIYNHDSFRLSQTFAFDEGDIVPGGYRIRGGSELVTQPDKNSRIEKWRLVSSGLKISCVNNATANAGWYEAVRINFPKDSKEWGVIPTPWGKYYSYGVTNTNNVDPAQRLRMTDYLNNTRLYIGGQTQFTEVAPGRAGIGLPHVNGSVDMSSNPTYTSGKLRDMHKIIFKLRPTSDEHDYKDIPQILNRAFGGLNYPWNKIGPDENNGGTLVDDNFDAIHIRIHGEIGTRILLHYVANQEIVFEETSVASRLSTSNVMAGSERDIARCYLTGTSGNAAPPSDYSSKLVSMPFKRTRKSGNKKTKSKKYNKM